MVRDSFIGLGVNSPSPFYMGGIMSLKDKLLIKELQKQIQSKDKIIEEYKNSNVRSADEEALLKELEELKNSYMVLIKELKDKISQYEGLIKEQTAITEAFRKKVNDIKIGI